MQPSLDSQICSDADCRLAVQDLAQRCMNPDPHLRPAFSETRDVLESIRDLAERGLLARTPSLPDASRSRMGELLGSIKVIDEGEEDGKGGTPT